MAAKYGKICDLRNSPPVLVEYDAATGQILLVEEDEESHGESQAETTENGDGEAVRLLLGPGPDEENALVKLGRNILSRSDNFLRAPKSSGDAPIASRMLDSESTVENLLFSSNERIFTARSCPCVPKTYCIVDGISGVAPDSCGVPWSAVNHTGDVVVDYQASEIGCFEMNGQTVFVRNAWPVVVLWYGALSVFLLATSNGRFARAHARRLLCPRLQSNERWADRVLTREHEARARLRAAAVRVAEDVAATGGTTGPGPSRRLVRTRGVRLPATDGGSAARRRAGMTVEEERQEATRWWIQQAEQLGILSRGVRYGDAAPRRVEYVLRTRRFSAERERAHRARLKQEKNGTACLVEGAPSAFVAGPLKRVADDDRDGILTPNTSTLSLDEGEDEPPSLMDVCEPTGAGSPSPKSNACSVDDEDTFECTICLTAIEEGERVGILPCMHIFHSDCLRQWIMRRNACPLCQATEIATIRPAADVEAGGSGNAQNSGPLSSDRNAPNNNAEAGEGGATPPRPTSVERSRHDRLWFMPAFFSPESPNTAQRRPVSSPQQSRLVFSTSPLSDNDSPLSGPRRARRERQRRRRRRERRLDDLW